MIRYLVPAAAALALAACGAQSGEENEANGTADAAANLAEMLPNELGGDDISDANLADGPEAAPAAAPAPPAQPKARPEQPAPKAEPRRPPATKAPPPPPKSTAEPDPHAGHDMANMSHD